jgi:hypothetical protein
MRTRPAQRSYLRLAAAGAAEFRRLLAPVGRRYLDRSRHDAGPGQRCAAVALLKILGVVDQISHGR